jgi:hypothetical protein
MRHCVLLEIQKNNQFSGTLTATITIELGPKHYIGVPGIET